MIRFIIRQLDHFLLSASFNPINRFAISMQMSKQERMYVANCIRGKNNLLEIGSGYSTLWFSQFVCHIVSVESRKEWFDKITDLLNYNKISTVQLYHFPPETSAYDEQGLEKWNNRNTSEGSDYGTAEEFSGYLHGIEELVSNNKFDIILVDGNVREEIIRMLQQKKYAGKILLHDVKPERDYLNKQILTMEKVIIINKVDTLVELAINNHGNKFT
jgi:hypothetical protein